MKRLIQSILIGTLAGAAMPSIYTIAIAVRLFWSPLERGQDYFWILIAILPLAVSFATVAAASILIGLPASALLRRYDAESFRNYTIIGAGFGIALPMVILLVSRGGEPYLVSLLGGFAGVVTAAAWWQLRPSP